MAVPMIAPMTPPTAAPTGPPTIAPVIAPPAAPVVVPSARAATGTAAKGAARADIIIILRIIGFSFAHAPNQNPSASLWFRFGKSEAICRLLRGVTGADHREQ
jgi:hypothetical protein